MMFCCFHNHLSFLISNIPFITPAMHVTSFFFFILAFLLPCCPSTSPSFLLPLFFFLSSQLNRFHIWYLFFHLLHLHLFKYLTSPVSYKIFAADTNYRFLVNMIGRYWFWSFRLYISNMQALCWLALLTFFLPDKRIPQMLHWLYHLQ